MSRTGHGNIGTSHMYMVMLTVDEPKCLLAPHLVNYGFVRELLKRDFTIIEVPVEGYWDLALNRRRRGRRSRRPKTPGTAATLSGSRSLTRPTRTRRVHHGQWWRSHGNEHWEFDERGLMR